MIRARTRTVARTAIGLAAGTMIRAAKKADRCAQSVADQVAQRIVLHALVDPVTFAESFDLNDSPAHPLTIHFKICLTRDTPGNYALLEHAWCGKNQKNRFQAPLHRLLKKPVFRGSLSA